MGVRETPSLEAYRAFTEGSLHLESLDLDEMEQAIGDFEGVSLEVECEAYMLATPSRAL